MCLKSIALNFRVWSAAFSVLFQPIVQSSVQLPIAPQLIRDVRVFDGENVIEHRSVLIEDGKISQIGGSRPASRPHASIEGTNLKPKFVTLYEEAVKENVEPDSSSMKSRVSWLPAKLESR